MTEPPPPVSAPRPEGEPVEAPPEPRRRMRPRDALVPLGLSLAAMAGVFWWTYEPGAFSLVASSFRPGVLALAFVALALQITAGGLRMRHVSSGLLTRRAGIRSQLTWDFMSAITPSAMGGAPLASLIIAGANRLPVGQVTAVMLFLILMDQIWFATLIVVMYVSAVWLPVFPTGLGAVGIGTVGTYLGGMLVYIGFFAYATLVRPELIERAANGVVKLKWLRRFAPTVRREAEKMRRQAKVLRGRPLGFYLTGAGLTLLYWLGRYGVLLMVALSLTPEPLRVVLFLLRTAGLWLAGLVMPTPGGAGGIEALFVLYLSPLLPAGVGGPVLLAWRLIAYYFVLALGAFVAGEAVRRMLFGSGTPSAEPAPDPPAHSDARP